MSHTTLKHRKLTAINLRMSNPDNNIDANSKILDDVTAADYKYGFTTDIDTDVIPRGLNEDVVRLISAKRTNPNGCSISGLRLIAIGSPSSNRNGLTSTYPTSTSKRFLTTPRPSKRTGRKALTKLTPKSSPHSTASASRSRSRKCCREWLSMPSWTLCR